MKIESVTYPELIQSHLQHAKDAMYALELISLNNPKVMADIPDFDASLREIGRRDTAIRYNLLRNRYVKR